VDIPAKPGDLIVFGEFEHFDSWLRRPLTNLNNRHTPVAWLNKLILIHIPNGVLALDRLVTGGRFTSSLYRCGSFVVYDRHPTVLVSDFLVFESHTGIG
jgi:hypothetical protein